MFGIQFRCHYSEGFAEEKLNSGGLWPNIWSFGQNYSHRRIIFVTQKRFVVMDLSPPSLLPGFLKGSYCTSCSCNSSISSVVVSPSALRFDFPVSSALRLFGGGCWSPPGLLKRFRKKSRRRMISNKWRYICRSIFGSTKHERVLLEPLSCCWYKSWVAADSSAAGGCALRSTMDGMLSRLSTISCISGRSSKNTKTSGAISCGDLRRRLL